MMLRAQWEANARYFGRVYQMDRVTVALGRMGWGEKRFRELDRVLAEVDEEYAEEVISDSKGDKELWYYKDRLDRELKQYVGDLFVPYDERYAREGGK